MIVHPRDGGVVNLLQKVLRGPLLLGAHTKVGEHPEKLLVCGCCTDICVLHTVTDARNRDYRVQVYTDCVAVIDQDMARFALKHMEQILGVELVSLGEGSSS